MSEQWKDHVEVPAEARTDRSRTPGWSTERVSFSYSGASRPALQEVSVELPAGQCTAILGPNGSGKSTLLKLLLGALKPPAGRISFGGRGISSWSRKELAKTVGVVPQGEEISFPLTVRELVAMGRYPHLGAFRASGPADVAAVEAAMDRCDIGDLADRSIQTLSGGERQRARLARALAQEPRVLALDEPTLALDIRHEMEIFELLRHLTLEGVTVVIVTHSLNLASRYADQLILLENGCVAAAGTPSQVLQQDRLEKVYQWPLVITRHPGPGPDLGAPQVTPVAQPLHVAERSTTSPRTTITER
jgi:iron complex transport system ATP-binding protein